MQVTSLGMFVMFTYPRISFVRRLVVWIQIVLVDQARVESNGIEMNHSVWIQRLILERIR